jgi:hypothetical protein
VKVHEVFDEPRIDFTLLENIVVPPDECRDGRDPRQMHQWDYVDADELAMRFPEHEDEHSQGRHERSPRGGTATHGSSSRTTSSACGATGCPSARSRPWNYNPKKKYANYKPGRATLVLARHHAARHAVEQGALPVLDDDLVESHQLVLQDQRAERIMGIQRALNKNNWVIEKGNDNVGRRRSTSVRPTRTSERRRTA